MALIDSNRPLNGGERPGRGLRACTSYTSKTLWCLREVPAAWDWHGPARQTGSGEEQSSVNTCTYSTKRQPCQCCNKATHSLHSVSERVCVCACVKYGIDTLVPITFVYSVSATGLLCSLSSYIDPSSMLAQVRV